jgi:hypothetical protein
MINVERRQVSKSLEVLWSGIRKCFEIGKNQVYKIYNKLKITFKTRIFWFKKPRLLSRLPRHLILSAVEVVARLPCPLRKFIAALVVHLPRPHLGRLGSENLALVIPATMQETALVIVQMVPNNPGLEEFRHQGETPVFQKLLS